MQPLDLDMVDLMIRVVVLDNFKIYSFHSGSVDRFASTLVPRARQLAKNYIRRTNSTR
jgi:hypothetical protein